MQNSRRRFIKKAFGGAMAAAVPASFLGASGKTATFELIQPKGKTKFSANDHIQIAGIGIGIMGMQHCRTLETIAGAKLVAVCDLYDGHLKRAQQLYGKDLFTTRNYKEILERDDIDAVFVGTSDHWHDHITIEALNKGKAVYCEKPMVHKIEEGKAMIEAEKSSGKVLQVGSQRVSSILYHKAKELYESGIIGKLIMAEAVNDRHSALGAWQYSIPTDASPDTVDWERFIGDAPKRAFDKVRFFRWRNYRDYGTGVAGDLFVHLFSGMHVVLSSHGPERIYTTGGLRYWKDGRDVPDVILGCFDYPQTKSHPAFNLQLRVNFVDGGGGGSVFRLIGTDGTIDIGWGGLKVTRNEIADAPGYGGWDTFGTFTEAQQEAYKEWYAKQYPKGKPQIIEPEVLEYRTPEGYSDNWAHWTNFVEAVRDNKKVIEDGAFGLRAAAPSLAANMSYFDKKIINWNPEKMELE